MSVKRASNDINRAPKETEKDRIDKLVKWYEQFKPEAGKRIDVNLGPKALSKALGCQPTEEGGKEFTYRQRILVAIGKDRERY